MRFEHEEAIHAEPSESLPEILLPTQLEHGSRMGAALGERRLLWAMLLDAVTCFCKHRRARDNAGRKLFREAERWIRARDDRWSFSFQSVCACSVCRSLSAVRTLALSRADASTGAAACDRSGSRARSWASTSTR